MPLLIGRVLSLLIALGYVVGLFLAADEINAGFLCPCVYLLFPLALIWFPEQVGEFTGYVGRGGNIDTESPPMLVSIFGWIFRLAPLALPFFISE